MRTRFALAVTALASLPTLARPAVAGDAGSAAGSALGADVAKAAADSLAKGRAFLLGKRDESTGAWDPKGDVPAGFTAVATLALIGSTPRESVAADPVILGALKYLASRQHGDGSIWSNNRYVNYETCNSVGTFAAARVAEFAGVQLKAKDHILASQITRDEADANFGGFPYVDEEPDQPTDLSNLQFALAALRDAGVPADNPVFQRAQKFLSRVQNRSETNTFVAKVKDGSETKEVVSGNDGGAVYAAGVSKAALVKRADGKYEAPSYGSMTYALVKCLLLAGVKADDPRVVAAFGWISKNFTVARNPGFEHEKDPANAGQQGYYYYVMTMSRALADFERASGKPLTVTDPEGKTHEWRKELAAQLASAQKADGSWQNPVERWEESNPLLATSFAMQALAYCTGRFP